MSCKREDRTVSDVLQSAEQSLGSRRARGKWAAVAGVLVVVVAIPLFVKSPYWIGICIDIMIYGVAASSLRTILISGQFPMGHGAFMGVGAYAAGMCSRWLEWSPWITIPLGAVVAASIGLAFGYPFSRLRALYYAMGSLFFGVAIVNAIQAFGSVTGGYMGLSGIRPIFAGPSKVPYFYFFLGLALLSLLALHRFESCRIGKNLKAIAQAHVVASSIGINESRYRIFAVAVGCFFVGLVGAANAHYAGLATPTTYNLMTTFWMVMYALIGGIGSFVGPMLGTVFLRMTIELARGLQEYTPFLTAGILIIVAYFVRKGIVGLAKSVMDKYSNFRTTRRMKSEHVAGS